MDSVNNGQLVRSHNPTTDLEISVAESEKRTNGTLNIREFYTVYLIETKVSPLESGKNPTFHTVWRRYTEFEQLKTHLEITHPYVVIPPLPEKRILFAWQKISSDTLDPNFIDRRRAGLENFLLRIAAHPILNTDPHFMRFLCEQSEFHDLKPGNLLEKLKTLNITLRIRNVDTQFEGIKEYSVSLQSNLNNLLKMRAKVAEKQYNVHKLHANYGRVFSEWSVAEKDMGDGLQRTGHYLDSLASGIDAHLEDEELLADQLKEYLFFAQGLQNVCKNYELLQLEVETAEDTVAGKNNERNRVQQGKSGLMSRLFGAVETDEVRELKVTLLDQQIQEGAVAVNKSKTNLDEFTKKALAEVDRFQRQKVADLRETLQSYTALQLKIAKKGLQTWTQIRSCLENIP